MARDRGLMVTGPMLLTLALEEAKKKASLSSRFLRGVSAGEAAPRHRRNDSVRRSSSLPHPRDRLEDGVSPGDYQGLQGVRCIQLR